MFEETRDHRSTAEVEYVAVAAIANQAHWIRKLMTDLQTEQEESIQIVVDNQVAIGIANNLVFHAEQNTSK